MHSMCSEVVGGMKKLKLHFLKSSGRCWTANLGNQSDFLRATSDSLIIDYCGIAGGCRLFDVCKVRRVTASPCRQQATPLAPPLPLDLDASSSPSLKYPLALPQVLLQTTCRLHTFAG